ncbi:TVP38/TMEM64 family protein, partial [Rhodovulum adriaticum]|uniref:TVP38/TMEM64 family protein n=1 Tax=Rhodovulum adriaticum TaxID=35804 RepID=UPI001903D80A
MNNNNDEMIEEIKSEKLDDSTKKKRKIVHRVGIVIAILIIALTLYAFVNGYFVDRTKFTKFLGHFGIFAPFIFIFIQAFFTVFPVNPSGITNISVVMAYGPWIGLVLNYIAIMIGSVINFHLGRKYGKRFI